MLDCTHQALFPTSSHISPWVFFFSFRLIIFVVRSKIKQQTSLNVLTWDMLPKIPPTKLLSIQFSTIKPTAFQSYLNYKLLSYPCYSQIATTCSPNNNPLNKNQQVDFSNISLLSQNSALLRWQVGFHTRLIKCQALKMFKSQLLSGEKKKQNA